MSKKLLSIVLTLIALVAVIPVIYAETSSNWETAPDFRSSEVVWMLAPNQTEPKIGEVVWAVPAEKNTTTPDADDPVQPLETITPTQPPIIEEDNTLLIAALIITLSFIPLLLASLLRRRSKATVSLAFIAFLACSMVFTAYNVPAASADQMATSGYKLANPTGMSDYQLHNYTDGSFGVNRMSDWANLVTFIGYVGGNPEAGLITPTLAGYSTNASAIWENIFDVISYGVIESKEVAVGYSTGLEAWQTAIPDDVQVDVSYQGNMYRFANPLNTAGSPYTVSVGAKVMDGYYTAEDSKGRILWSSLNYSYVMNSCIQAGKAASGSTDIVLTSPVYYYTSPIIIDGIVTVQGITQDVTIYQANNTNSNCFEYTSSAKGFWFNLRNVKLWGNSIYNTGAESSAVYVNPSGSGELGGCYFFQVCIWNWSGYGIYAKNPTMWRVTNCLIEECGNYAGYFTGGQGAVLTSSLFDDSLGNLYVATGRMKIIGCEFYEARTNGILVAASGNTVIDGCIFRENAQVNNGTAYYDIRVAGGDGTIISNCQFLGNISYPAQPTSAIQVQSTATNTTIIGNHFDTANYGTSYDSRLPVTYRTTGSIAQLTKIVGNIGYFDFTGSVIANPIFASTGYLADNGGNSTWVSEKVYTNTGSDKTIMVAGGTVTAIDINGVSTGLTAGVFDLGYAWTFKVTFSSAPTITVMGK